MVQPIIIPVVYPLIPPVSLIVELLRDGSFVISRVREILISSRDAVGVMPIVFTFALFSQEEIIPSFVPAIPPVRFSPMISPFTLQSVILPLTRLIPAIPPTSDEPITVPLKLQPSILPLLIPTIPPTRPLSPSGVIAPSTLRLVMIPSFSRVENSPAGEYAPFRSIPLIVCPLPSKTPLKLGTGSKSMPSREISAPRAIVLPIDQAS